MFQDKLAEPGTPTLARDLVDKAAPSPDYSVVSYFAGCGGMDLGFIGGFEYKGEILERLPFDIIAAYDSDEKCVRTYNEYFATKAEVRYLTEDTAAEAPAADVLIGGFPCQDFSVSGPRLGLNSERGRAYLSLTAYMETHRPRLVVFENVPHIEKIGRGSAIKAILESFKGAGNGYRFETWRLNGAEYGVPQNRTRLFFIGVRDDLDGMPIMPTPLFNGNPRPIEWAISDLESVTDESIPNQSQYFKANLAKKGHGQGDEKNKKGKPAYTIRANAKSRVQFHYSLERRLTVRECARIQTFPDDFIFTSAATTSIMQIGNAVPPLLAYRAAESVAKFLNQIK